VLHRFQYRSNSRLSQLIGADPPMGGGCDREC
jgi:hypothetical protein